MLQQSASRAEVVDLAEYRNRQPVKDRSAWRLASHASRRVLSEPEVAHRRAMLDALERARALASPSPF